jgi:hypothetical protein
LAVLARMLRRHGTPGGFIDYESCARGYLLASPAAKPPTREISDQWLTHNVGVLLQVFEASGFIDFKDDTGDYDGIVELGWAEKTTEGGPWQRVMMTVQGSDIAEQILHVVKASTEGPREEDLLVALEPIAKKYRVSAQSLRAVWYYARGVLPRDAKSKIPRADGRGYITSSSYVSNLAEYAIAMMHNSGVLTYYAPEGQPYPFRRDKCKQIIEFFLSETPYTLNLGDAPRVTKGPALLPGKKDPEKEFLRVLSEIAADARTAGLDPDDVFILGKDGKARPGRLLKLYGLPSV